jgi:hypothetical protein
MRGSVSIGYPHPDSVKNVLCFNEIRDVAWRKVVMAKDFSAES